MGFKNMSIRIDAERLEKLKYIAAYEERSVNRHLLILIRKNIEEFERKLGKINVKEPEI